MGRQFTALTDKHIDFISAQKLFFVGTAASTGTVNLSPKGMDSFRIIDQNTVSWLNVTGSGNETAAHVQLLPRMTLMFCAFESAPEILRLYGNAQVLHQGDAAWQDYSHLFPDLPGARQIFVVTVAKVQSSCGLSVPYFSYQGERDQLNRWAEKKQPEGIRQYWLEKNQLSLDEFDTHIKQLNPIKDEA